MAKVSEAVISSETEPLCEEQGIYLRPLAKIEITVKLPRIRVPGQSISNWDLMERLKKVVKPIELDAIRVRESSLECVIFEAELLTRPMMKQALKVLDGVTMKVSGFSEPLKVRAKESKSEFPSRHDWDLFYMKNKMNEQKPGERPDTLHLSKLPVKWFNDGIVDGPSELLFKHAMSTFGTVRLVDIPVCDPLRIHMTPKYAGFQSKGFGFGLAQDVFFEGYVQFEEYKGFLMAMAGLRNMKWIKEIDGKMYQANVKVDFDRTRHLSDDNIKRRQDERDLMVAKKRKEEETARLAREEAETAVQREEEEKERRRAEREKKRKEKREEERKREIERKLEEKKMREAEKLAKESRELHSERLLECVFTRIQAKEDRLRRDEEAKLKADLRTVHMEDLAPGDKEDKLRQMLLRQREMRMRERLKEKLMQNTAEKSDSSSEDEKYKKRSRNEKKHKKHRSRSRSRGKKKKHRSRSSS